MGTPTPLIIEGIAYDPGTISAPAFLDLRIRDADGEMWSFELSGKQAKKAFKRYKIGDVYDNVPE